MSKKDILPVIQIQNLRDFRKQYLSFDRRMDCESIRTAEAIKSTGFLEVLKLENMKIGESRQELFLERRSFYSVILLEKGAMQIQIGTESFQLNGTGLYFVSANQLHSICKCDTEIKGYQLVFDEDYYLLCLNNQIKLTNFIFFLSTTVPVLHLEQKDVNNFRPLIEKMESEYCRQNSSKDELLVKLYLNIFLIELERSFEFHEGNTVSGKSKKALLVAEFHLLVKKNFITKRLVSDYAKMLFVTPHYLNDAVREVTGSNASSVINNQLILAAKGMIVQTESTFSGIASNLNFSSQTYFSKFFKKHTGITPQIFRQQHLVGESHTKS